MVRCNLGATVLHVSGTIQRLEYGASPTVQLNKQQATSIAVAPWLEPDLRLIERTLQVGFFHYGPRLWMVGEVAPLKALQKSSSRAAVITRILNEYPGRILNTDESFYRPTEKLPPTRVTFASTIRHQTKSLAKAGLTQTSFQFSTDLRILRSACTNVELPLTMSSISQRLCHQGGSGCSLT